MIRPKLPGAMVDFIHENRAYDFKRGVRERSRLRGMLMDLAGIIDVSPLARGNLVLIEPELSTETVAEVWAGAARIFRPEVLERLAMIEARSGENLELELKCHPDDLAENELKKIEKVVKKNRGETGTSVKSAPGNSVHEVLRVILARWLTEVPPTITLAQLGEETGYTYKTVRHALDKLSEHVVRLGNRGVELKSFPRSAWARLLLDTHPFRETILFRSRGEMPRTPGSLLKRFKKIPGDEVENVGIGGVEGARSYAPDLDLIGLPRLDFTIHCPDSEPDLQFVHNLDPALEPTEDPAAPCSLAIHLLRRPRSYFQERAADPVECLLDLQEMRLEAQARQLLRSFPATKNEDF